MGKLIIIATFVAVTCYGACAAFDGLSAQINHSNVQGRIATFR